MDRIVAYIIAALLSCSCGIRKAVPKTDYRQEEAVRVERNTFVRSEGISFSAGVLRDSLDESLVIVEEYDSTLPVDPSTGTPPLKRREITRDRSRIRDGKTVSTSVQQDTMAEAVSGSGEAVQALSQEQVSSASPKKGRKGMRPLAKWLALGAAAATAVLLLRTAFKHCSGGILTVFKSIFKRTK